jgi:hypothetical protein
MPLEVASCHCSSSSSTSLNITMHSRALQCLKQPLMARQQQHHLHHRHQKGSCMVVVEAVQLQVTM